VGMPTNNLQDFFEIQMQLNNDLFIFFKFKTILTNLSPNMNPLTQNNPYLPHFLTTLNVFCTLEVLNGRLENLFQQQKKEQCVRSQLPLKS